MARYNRRQKSGAGKGLVFLFLVLLVIAAGAGLAFRDRITEFLQGGARPPELGKRRTAPAEPVGKPAPPPRAVQRPVEPSPEPARPAPPPSADEEGARRRLGAAQEAYSRLEFSKARALAEQAARLARGTPTASSAAQLAARAATFHSLLRDVERNPEAERNLTRLRMEDNTLTVVIEEKNHREYRVLLDNGIRATIPAEDVLEEIPVPLEEKKKEFRSELAEYKQRMSPKGAVGMYLAGVFAYRNSLEDEVLPLLENAYDGSDNLLADASDYHAGKLLSLAMYWDSIGRSYRAARKLEELLEKYPESRHVSDARELLSQIRNRREEQILTFKVKEEAPSTSSGSDTPSSSTGGSGSSVKSSPAPSDNGSGGGADQMEQMDRISVTDTRAQKLVEEADGLFKKGMKHYLAGRPGMPNHNQELRKAAPLFEKAANLYTEAAEICPQVSRLENRASEAARLHYNCNKMQELDMF